MKEPTKHELSVVIVGSLNPRIFHPQWFSTNGLIKKKEGDWAEENIKIINNDFSIFDCDWFDLTIDRNRLQAKTSQEAFHNALRDLAIGTFTILEHTPVKQLGINNNLFFKFSDQESLIKIGEKLAPKSNWDGIIKYQSLMDFVLNAEREGDLPGYYQIHVKQEDPDKYILKIGLNDHYELDSTENPIHNLIDILKTNWKTSISESFKIADHLLSL